MYRGRFAPSPTGPLHFGSLVAATASYLEAAHHHGQWLVRMEDADSPRTIPDAADAILRALEVFGFEWEGDVIYQSRRGEAYAAALERLQHAGLVYPCACSRKEIADSAAHRIDAIYPGAIYPSAIYPSAAYPGTCRHGVLKTRAQYAMRLKTEQGTITFDDEIQGSISQDLSRDIGDFVLKRADGIYAYQLAVVVDDADQGITHVVRGADLLDSTARQIYLQQKLGMRTPAYAHVPVAANALGEKLSKQTLARPIDLENPVPPLWQALHFLGQEPPAELQLASLEILWDWAGTHWRMHRILPQRSIEIAGA